MENRIYLLHLHTTQQCLLLVVCCLSMIRTLLCWQPYMTRNSSGDEIANVNSFTTTSSTTFTQCAPEDTEFCELTQNKCHYAFQGHSRSPVLVPIKSSCTTSYWWLILTYLSCTVFEIQPSTGPK